MKKVRLIVALTAMMMTISVQVNAQENESEIVIIRLMEDNLISNGVMVVTHAGKTTKTLDLPALNQKNLIKSEDDNAIILEKEINQWKAEGFLNITMSSSSSEKNVLTTVILSK